MSSNISTSATDLAHLQIQFISSDEKLLSNLPNEIVNVPITSEPEQLNLLVNKISESTNENWTPINFDFLIDSILLRTSLFEFIENYRLSLENVLKIECIVQTPAPKPEHDSKDTEWVASLKILDQNCILSVNYGGQFSVWSGSKKFEKILTEQLDEDPMKCLDIFWKEKELFALIGAQNQTIILAKIKLEENGEEKQNFKFIPQSILRGHQRSVECLAANKEGTRVISGSFDKCMKVWNIEEIDRIDDDEQQSHSTGEKRSKRMRIESKLPTKTPMVTLQAHREAVVDLCWDPLNAGRAVSVSWDHQILIWDLELAGPIANLTSNKAFTSLALNPFNGLVLTGSTDPLVRMWDSKSKEGSMVKNTYSGHLGWVSDLCWSPSNENLFVSASFDKTVKMWDIRSPKAALYDLMGHEDRVLCVDWSQSGRIASGSADSTLKVFSCR